ncbi:MAG: DUF1850 domain-containing protein [Rhodoferax sp.]
MSLLGVCLVLAATAGQTPPPKPVFIPGDRFTLAWMHSIEKVRWEEDYVVVNGLSPAFPPLLVPVKARIHGSAAGMEPPDDAVLRNGWYEYTPDTPNPTELRLTRSEFTADYDWCDSRGCHPLSKWFASDRGVTVLKPCRAP